MQDEPSITLPARVLLPDGEERDCTVRFGEPETMMITPALAAEGDRLVCHVRGFGVFEGIAGCQIATGQEVRTRGTPSHLARLAARIAWHRRGAAGEGNQREHDRIVPFVADVTVRIASGEGMPGTLLDLSATGAALRLPARPEVGDPIVVGRRRATVVRHLDDGIAVRFVLPLPPQDVTPEIIL